MHLVPQAFLALQARGKPGFGKPGHEAYSITRGSAPNGAERIPPQVVSGVMQRLLLIAGALLLIAGFLWPWASRIPFGRLPGDLLIDRPGFKL